MQPILAIAALAVGAGLLSTGFLAGNNEFEIWVQDLGFANEKIESPIDHANVDFVVQKIEATEEGSQDNYYKNEIVQCSFHTFDQMDDGSEVICKLNSWLRDVNGEVIEPATEVTVCEGRYTFAELDSNNELLTDPHIPSETVYVDITMKAYDGACDVMNIDAVKIVASGEEPFSAFCEVPPGFENLGDLDNDGMYEPYGNDRIPDTEDDESCIPTAIIID